MKIYFYEEFPTKENLDKIMLVGFRTKLIVAAKSLREFYSVKSAIKKYRNVKEVIYWPILEKGEGYWFSAFTKNSALKRTTNELQQSKSQLTLMWDAEIPIKKSLIFSQLPYYFKNRRIILDFFKNSEKCNIKILTSEYPLESKFLRSLLFDLFLVSFDTKKYKNRKIAMLYTSFLKGHNNIEHFLENQIKIGKKYFGEDFMVALGTIAAGISGSEPILAPEELERDLRVLKNNGINEAVIFRLGGLNKEYAKAIRKYAD